MISIELEIKKVADLVTFFISGKFINQLLITIIPLGITYR